MHYYDPNDRRPRRWAVVVTMLYALLLGGSFAFVEFEFRRPDNLPKDEIEIELYEVPKPKPVPPPSEPAVERPRHVVESPEPPQTAQAEGPREENRTPNPKALFNINKSGADEPTNAGNPFAKEGEEQTSGTGRGLQPTGWDQLDRGLQARGLREALQKPSYPGNRGGKVVVRVTVNAAGQVTSAAFEPKGSTTSDAELVAAALEAARKARFAESRAAVEGGSITYLFTMN